MCHYQKMYGNPIKYSCVKTLLSVDMCMCLGIFISINPNFLGHGQWSHGKYCKNIYFHKKIFTVILKFQLVACYLPSS